MISEGLIDNYAIIQFASLFIYITQIYFNSIEYHLLMNVLAG